jgi:hypothetical protein
VTPLKLRLAVLVVLVGMLTLCLNNKSSQELKLKIVGEEVLMIVESNEDAHAFIEENFFNESERITDVHLKWNEETGEYVWELKITERECGCRGIEGLNVLEATVDPNTGEILDLKTRVGVDQDQLARETCEKGCHR